MTKQQELDRLAHWIKDAQARLTVFMSSSGILDKEIDLLTAREDQIKENLKFLKKKKVIALAMEYRKAKEELDKIKSRLTMVRADRQNIGRATADVEAFLLKNKERYSFLMKEPTNVVIRGIFGRNDGQS